LKKPEITLVIAASLDGRIAFPQGGESHLGSEYDRKLLNKSLTNVDATLFGSGTLKAHQSTFLIKKRRFLKNKQDISINQPISIIAGNSKNFSKSWKYFNQPITRWLISSDRNINDSRFKFDKTFFYKNSWLNTLNILNKEGIKRIALLGGSKLIESFFKEDLIDEIKITICPKIIGGQYTWIPFEEKHKIFNFGNSWKIQMTKVLKTSEIFIHYTKKSVKNKN
tara:strand:- start:542 stop:1213 length:672 start_codon:yes stop_codon:yes gene_type:complete